jgi:hypothetical protein
VALATHNVGMTTSAALPAVVDAVAASLTPTIRRKLAGIDNTADESCLVLAALDIFPPTTTAAGSKLAELFGPEAEQWSTEDAEGIRQRIEDRSDELLATVEVLRLASNLDDHGHFAVAA